MNAAYSSPHHSPEREKRRIPTSDFAGDDATNNISGWNPDTMEKSEVKVRVPATFLQAGWIRFFRFLWALCDHNIYRSPAFPGT